MTLPIWQATHAYIVGTRVTPTVPTTPATTFWVTVAGTSGNAEPSWPTGAPWTVTDGTVTWSLATSWRQIAVAGILATLTAFKAANPTLLKGVASARPRDLSNFDKPGAYIGSRDETVIHTGGLRTRTFGGLSVVVVDVTPSNKEEQARMDILIDALQDAFTAAYRSASPYAIVQQTSVGEIDLESYMGNVITFAQTALTEGRD